MKKTIAGRALLIGIDEYSDSIKRLYGAVRDVCGMAEYLIQEQGMASDNVCLLLNEEATRDGILNALGRLIEETSDGDVVVFHFSGHGSRISSKGRPDGAGREETIVPHDGRDRSTGIRDITSFELRKQFELLSLKTQKLLLIFDCCHSGRLSRDPFAVRTRWLPPPPSEFSSRREIESSGPDIGGELSYTKRYTLITACRPTEEAREIRLDDGMDHGALTHYLLDALYRAPPEASWLDVMEAVELEVSARFSEQHPRVQGAFDRKIFDFRRSVAKRYAIVRSVDTTRGELVLGAGIIHGTGKGSRWSIYPPGARRTDGEPLARVEVRNVRTGSSDADFLDGDVEGVQIGSRAVETHLGDGVGSLRVEVVTQIDSRQMSSRIEEMIRADHLLHLVETGGDVRVYLLAPRSAVGLGDPVPVLGTIDAPLLAAVDADGALLMPVRGLEARETRRALIHNLKHYARRKNLLALHSSDSLLDGAIDFTLLRQVDGSWQSVGTEAIFVHGERFAVELSHRCSQPLHLYLMSLSVDGRIDLIYPVKRAWEPLQPGEKACEGVQEPLSFRIVDEYPYERPGSATRVPEVIKLLATTEDVDLRPLFQSRYRALSGLSDTPLVHRLNRMLAGGSREIVRTKEAVIEPWSTLQKRVWIDRNERKSL